MFGIKPDKINDQDNPGKKVTREPYPLLTVRRTGNGSGRMEVVSKLNPRRFTGWLSAAREVIILTYTNPLCCSMGQVNDWFGAAKKTLLSNANKLLQDMQEYDKDNIPDKVIAVRSTCHHHVQLLLYECRSGKGCFVGRLRCTQGAE